MKTKPKKPTKAQLKEARRLVAQAAGLANAKKLGKEGRSALGRKGAKARWKNHEKKSKKSPK